MKFLAVLKDSFREAIDTKVFYVMVGLSVVVTLFTFTLGFAPQPAAKEMMEGATHALNAEAVGNLEDVKDFGDFMRRVHESRKDSLFDFVSGGPVEGSTDDPRGTYRAVVRALPLSGDAAGRLKASSESTEEYIRKHFGRIDEMQLVQVTDVRKVGRPPEADAKKAAPGEAYFEVTAKPTAVTRRVWPHRFTLCFGAVEVFSKAPLAVELYLIEHYVVGWVGASVAILISIIITAFFIPNMLRKGTVDLLVVKPIHRTTLLLYKFVGGLTFIFLNTAVVVVGVWLALSLRSGVWAPGFLWMIPILTFSFAILYAVSALFGVLTRSAIVAILMTVAAWAVLFIVSVLYFFAEETRKHEDRFAKAREREAAQRKAEGKPEEDEPAPRERASEHWFFKTVRVVHFMLPRRGDLNTLTSQILLRDLLTANQVKAQKIDDTPVSWGESLAVSLLFMGVFLGLACWRFSTKDY